MEKITARVRVNTLRELDALVGEHLTHEVPEIYWEDAHAVFRFETEEEALDAIKRIKAQMILPKFKWDDVAVTQIKSYRPYSSEIAMAWSAMEKINLHDHPLRLRRDRGMWYASFGDHGDCAARSAPVAMCAAGLLTVGVEAIYDPDRIN